MDPLYLAEPASEGADAADLFGGGGPASVDLNIPANLEALEDPGLLGHIRERRAACAQIEARARALPSPARLGVVAAEARRSLSSAMQMLEAVLRGATAVVDGLEALAAGGPPPAGGAPPGRPRLKPLAADLEAEVGRLRDAVSALTRARRGFEEAEEGLGRRAAHFELAAAQLTAALAPGGLRGGVGPASDA